VLQVAEDMQKAQKQIDDMNSQLKESKTRLVLEFSAYFVSLACWVRSASNVPLFAYYEMFILTAFCLSVPIALCHMAAMLSPRRIKNFIFARLNSFSSFSLQG